MDDGRGQEPDYRFTLANERTFLAWVRTALALVAAGVAVVTVVPELGPPGTRTLVGVALAGLAALVSAGGLLRWFRVQRAMRDGGELPPTRLPLLLALALVALSAAVAVLLAVSGRAG